MAFINFINAGGGGGGGEAYSALNETFIEVIDRSVSSITIPSGTTTIGENAFASCSALTEVVIPASVTSIEANAFADNESLETITFEGDTPPTLAEGAFSQLPSDVTINVPSGATDAYSAVTEEIEDSVIPYVKVTDPNGDNWTFEYTDATIPANAFRNWGSCKVEMNNGIKEIGNEAFNNMQALSSLTLSENVEVFGNYAFNQAVSLTGHLNLPNVKTIGLCAFNKTALSSIDIGSGLTDMSVWAIYSPNLSAVTFHSATPAANIHEEAIGSDITNGQLRVDTGVTGFDLDEWIKFKITHLPNWSLTDLAGNNIEGNYMMFVSGDTMEIYRPSGTTISNSDQDMPQGVYDKMYSVGMEEIDDNCFMNTQATECYFDSSLTKSKCTPLRGSLPTKVTYKSTSYDYFDARICESCTNLSSITFYCQSAPLTNIEAAYSSWTASQGELCVPNGGKDWEQYKEYVCGEDWVVKDLSGHTMNLVMEYTDTNGHNGTYHFYNEIPSYFFANHSELVEVVLPDACNDILTGTFQDCSALTAVTIPSTCWRIQFAVFNSCTALTNITCYATTAPEISDRLGDEPFRNVSPTGTLNIPSGSTASYSAWTAQLGSGWTVNEMSGQTTSPYCEIDNTDWIRDYGVNIKVGTSPAPIRITYNDEQTVTIVDGRILYMQPVGEFSVNYDAENDDIVIIENSSQEPITQQQREAMEKYVDVKYDSDYGFIKYVFGEIDTVTVDNDDYTGLYTYCEYME